MDIGLQTKILTNTIGTQFTKILIVVPYLGIASYTLTELTFQSFFLDAFPLPLNSSNIITENMIMKEPINFYTIFSSLPFIFNSFITIAGYNSYIYPTFLILPIISQIGFSIGMSINRFKFLRYSEVNPEVYDSVITTNSQLSLLIEYIAKYPDKFNNINAYLISIGLILPNEILFTLIAMNGEHKLLILLSGNQLTLGSDI